MAWGKTRLDCPRCGLTLKAQKYENEPVQACEGCWGYWVESARLKSILTKEIEKFSEGEKRSVFQTWASKGDENRQGAEKDAVDCPACKTRMSRRAFHPECPVVVDECKDHGVWLDTGEIKELQIFVESRKKNK